MEEQAVQNNSLEVNKEKGGSAIIIANSGNKNCESLSKQSDMEIEVLENSVKEVVINIKEKRMKMIRVEGRLKYEDEV